MNNCTIGAVAVRDAPNHFGVYAQDIDVTIDKSLKAGSRLSRSRNVLKRSERIARLQFEDNWVEGQSPYGLPKVRVLKTVVGKKKKKKKKEEDGDSDDS